MKARVVLLTLLVQVVLFAGILSMPGCGGKAQTDPWATFNSIGPRCNRIATIYAPAALDALPLLASELKWDATKTEAARGWIIKVRDTCASVSTALGAIKDSAITADQRLLIGPLLVAIGDGLDRLDHLNLFGSLESSSKVEIGLRITALGLRETGRLLSLPKPVQ